MRSEASSVSGSGAAASPDADERPRRHRRRRDARRSNDARTEDGDDVSNNTSELGHALAGIDIEVPPVVAPPPLPVDQDHDMHIPAELAAPAEEQDEHRARIDWMYTNFQDAALHIAVGQYDERVQSAASRLHIVAPVGIVLDLGTVDTKWQEFLITFAAIRTAAEAAGVAATGGFRAPRAGDNVAALEEAVRYRERLTQIARWAYIDFQTVRVAVIPNAAMQNPGALLGVLYAPNASPMPDCLVGEMLPSREALEEMSPVAKNVAIIRFVLAHASAYGLRVSIGDPIGGKPSLETTWLMAPHRAGGAGGPPVAVYARYCRASEFGWRVCSVDHQPVAWEVWVGGGPRLHTSVATAIVHGGGSQLPRHVKDMALLAVDNGYFDTTTMRIIAPRELAPSRVARVLLAGESATPVVVAGLGHAPLEPLFEVPDPLDAPDEGPITLDPEDRNALPPDVLCRIMAAQGFMGDEENDPLTRAAALRTEAHASAVRAGLEHAFDTKKFQNACNNISAQWKHWMLCTSTVPKQAAVLRLARINLSARCLEGAAAAVDAAEDVFNDAVDSATMAWREVAASMNTLMRQAPDASAVAWSAMCAVDSTAVPCRAAAEAGGGAAWLFPSDLICVRCLRNATNNENAVLRPNGTAPRPVVLGRLREDIVGRFGLGALDRNKRWFNARAPYMGHTADFCPRAAEAAASLAAHLGKCIQGPQDPAPRMFELITMMYGTGGSGKSTLIAAVSATYEREDVGNLESGVNTNWYLTNVYDRAFIVMPELQRNSKLPIGELCKIASGEMVTVNRRNVDQEDRVIRANVAIASNGFDIADTSGNMLRRLWIWLFQHAPLVSDYTLGRLAHTQRFLLAVRCLLHYHAWRGAAMRPPRWAPHGPPRGTPGTCPLYTMRVRVATHGDMDTFVAFLTDGAHRFVHADGAYIPFDRCIADYRAATPGHARDVKPDDGAFKAMGLTVNTQTRMWPQYESPGDTMAQRPKNTVYVIGLGYADPNAPEVHDEAGGPEEDLLEWFLTDVQCSGGPRGTRLGRAEYSPLELVRTWMVRACGDCAAAHFTHATLEFGKQGLHVVDENRAWPRGTANMVTQWYVVGVTLPLV